MHGYEVFKILTNPGLIPEASESGSENTVHDFQNSLLLLDIEKPESGRLRIIYFHFLKVIKTFD